jgi:hypothetical protein
MFCGEGEGGALGLRQCIFSFRLLLHTVKLVLCCVVAGLLETTFKPQNVAPNMSELCLQVKMIGHTSSESSASASAAHNKPSGRTLPSATSSGRPKYDAATDRSTTASLSPPPARGELEFQNAVGQNITFAESLDILIADLDRLEKLCAAEFAVHTCRDR